MVSYTKPKFRDSQWDDEIWREFTNQDVERDLGVSMGSREDLVSERSVYPAHQQRHRHPILTCSSEILFRLEEKISKSHKRSDGYHLITGRCFMMSWIFENQYSRVPPYFPDAGRSMCGHILELVGQTCDGASRSRLS
jgi:hypothetical protein